jgi:uncharacterized protein YegL
LNPSSRRRLQITLSVVILVAAIVISYYSLVEATETSTSTVSVVQTVEVPTFTVSTAEVLIGGEPTDIYLVLDMSGSMGDTSPGGTSLKIDDAKKSGAEFVTIINPDANGNFTIGLVAFDSDIYTKVHLTHSSSDLLSGIDSLAPGSKTAMSDALKVASELLVKESRPGARRVILLMTDGLTNDDKVSTPDEAMELAKTNGIEVYAVAFGSDADTGLLQTIAQRTGGEYFFASTGDELVKSFGTVANTLVTVSAVTTMAQTVLTFTTTGNTVLTVSRPVHYGSRAMILLALPLIIFLPQLERGLTQAYEGLTTILRRQRTAFKRRPQTVSVCSRCEKPVRPGTAFCTHCGIRFPVTVALRRCRECGRPLRSRTRFCTRCGTQAYGA